MTVFRHRFGHGPRALLALAGLLALTACAVPGPKAPLTRNPAGAEIEAQLFLSPRGPDQPDARYDFPRLDARETRITLTATGVAPMPARLSCDGPARLLEGRRPGAGRYMRPGADLRFTLPGRHAEAMPRLVLPPETSSCSLSWGDNRLALVAEDRAEPETTRLDARLDTCLVPPAAALDPLARAFFADRVMSQTCARPVGKTVLYPDEIEALALRLERLTGAPVSRAALRTGDPDLPLDFRHAPQIDEIVVSYLHMRADLSGYLVVRALAFHAARGTKIRIALAGDLMLAKDRALLEALASQYPNVQIQYFRWQPDRLVGPTGIVNSLQRSQHIKIFAALSRQPGVSFALVGGRNMHDMFFYPELENRPTRPFLNDYDRASSALSNPLAFFNPYEDFEIGMFNRSVVADILSHFGKFWTRDRQGTVMAAATAASQESANAPKSGVMRHFISLPWADSQDQVGYYASLIDAARSEILAISPFTYPVPEIDAALARAAARGVRVRLVTRLISDEPPAMFVNGLNTNFYARHEGSFEMHAYTPEARLLHTKLIVIDRRLAVVASTNLNRRSFLHDSENGVVFLDRGVAGEIHALLERYVAGSEPLNPKAFFLKLGDFLSKNPELAQYF